MEQNNNTSPEKKDSILKSLAIAGFIGILLIVAWLSVQLVQVFPAAFNSLASLAEGVGESQETSFGTSTDLLPLTVTANTSLVSTGDQMTINWSDIQAAGSYVFSYDCVDGVAITHEDEDGQRAINCDTNYNVGDINTLDIAVESEKNRYADVPYTLAFLRTEDTSPRATGSNVVTVVNTEVTNEFAAGGDNDTTVDNAVVDVPDTTPTTENTVATTDPADTPADNEPAPTEPFAQTLSYTVPVSDPDGFTDLNTSFITMGEIINGTFFSGPVSQENPGAIQFAVRNVGTKTSDEWTYEVSLPNGDTYRSDEQVALKPNERAVLTIGYPSAGATLHTFEIEVETRSDRNRGNNDAAHFVIFTE